MHSNSTKFIALLNRLWDGKEFIAHRKTSDSFIVQDRRLTLNLMMQPLILEQMLAKNDGMSRHSGFLARCLISYPSSQMGERLYVEPPSTSIALQKFNNKIHDCLSESLVLDRNGCKHIRTIHLSKMAKKIWIKFFNEIEIGLKSKPHLMTIKDFASKAAENVARLAALFHLFEGKNNNIGQETIEQAIEVIRWHLNETNKIMSNNTDLIKNDDATKLLQWLVNKNHNIINTRQLQQFGPIREKSKLQNAITKLISHNYIIESSLDNKHIYKISPYAKDF